MCVDRCVCTESAFRVNATLLLLFSSSSPPLFLSSLLLLQALSSTRVKKMSWSSSQTLQSLLWISLLPFHATRGGGLGLVWGLWCSVFGVRIGLYSYMVRAQFGSFKEFLQVLLMSFSKRQQLHPSSCLIQLHYLCSWRFLPTYIPRGCSPCVISFGKVPYQSIHPDLCDTLGVIRNYRSGLVSG